MSFIQTIGDYRRDVTGRTQSLNTENWRQGEGDQVTPKRNHDNDGVSCLITMPDIETGRGGGASRPGRDGLVHLTLIVLKLAVV